MSDDSGAVQEPSEGTVHVEHHPPEAVFGLLGNETRLAIIRALGEAEADAVPFSDLQDAVGMRDSGQFNYHLGKLTGRFVRKTEDGYALTLAGEQLVGALLAGTYTATAETTAPLPVDAPCPSCGGEVVATYADDLVDMTCLDCDEWYNQVTFPPGILDQFEPGELPEAFDRWLLAVIERTHRGFCSNCAGRVTGHLVPTDEHPQGVRVEYPCERCGQQATVSAIVPVLLHPAGTGWLYEQGIDLHDVPLWEVGARVDDEVQLLETDPPAVAVTLTVDDSRLLATLGADLTVENIEQESV